MAFETTEGLQNGIKLRMICQTFSALYDGFYFMIPQF